MMIMSFYWSNQFTFWFKEWTTETNTWFALGLFAVFWYVILAMYLSYVKCTLNQKKLGPKSGLFYVMHLVGLLSVLMHLDLMLLVMGYNGFVLLTIFVGYVFGFMLFNLSKNPEPKGSEYVRVK